VWLRLVLGAVFVGMAVGQLASWRQMPEILGAYRAGVGSWPVVAGLIAAELVCGVWFLVQPRSAAMTPVWVYTAVSVVWAVLAVQAFVRGVSVANCGCFGVYLRQRLSGWVLAQDALLLVYAVVLIRSGTRAGRGAVEVGR
jgi:hypothetical protein